MLRDLSTRSKKPEKIYKTILIGQPSTGKSSLMHRYVKNQFTEFYQTTIGTEFQIKKIQINQNTQIKMQIWDTAGQETFRSIIKTFFRNAHAVLLIYNITNEKTLHKLEEWLSLAQQSTSNDTLYVLVGTHLDLETQRKVSRQMAKQWMEQHDVDFFFQTSSKTDLNVKTVFQQIGKRLFSMQFKNKQAYQSQSQIESIKLKTQKSHQTPTSQSCC